MDPHESAELRTAVERCLADVNVVTPKVGGKDTVIWGPTGMSGYRFAELPPSSRREGTPLEWTTRCLVTMYFIEHENEPGTTDEIYAWIRDVTPEKILEAVNLGVVVGLP